MGQVLLSIESIMDEHPINHEPAYENDRGPTDSTYARIVKYENINVAVCLMLEKFPPKFKHFRRVCEERFLKDYMDHVAACDSFKSHRNGITESDLHPFFF